MDSLIHLSSIESSFKAELGILINSGIIAPSNSLWSSAPILVLNRLSQLSGRPVFLFLIHLFVLVSKWCTLREVLMSYASSCTCAGPGTCSGFCPSPPPATSGLPAPLIASNLGPPCFTCRFSLNFIIPKDSTKSLWLRNPVISQTSHANWGNTSTSVCHLLLKMLRQHFKLVIHKCLINLGSCSSPYIDDITAFVFFQSPWLNTAAVLEKLKANGFIIKLGTFTLWVSWLWGWKRTVFYSWSMRGAISNVTRPWTKKQLRSFLILCSYYRKIVPMSFCNLFQTWSGEYTGRYIVKTGVECSWLNFEGGEDVTISLPHLLINYKTYTYESPLTYT